MLCPRSCAFVLAILLLPGCGSDRVQISGTVVYEDGSPLAEGTVCGELSEGGSHMVQGNVTNGAFSLGTTSPGDGAKPGKYKIMIQCRALGDAELAEGKKPALDRKFGSYESSGLTLDIASARSDVKFVVSRPGNGKQK